MIDKILKLTLTKQPFEDMATGEISIAVRKPSKWLLSRLLRNDGTSKNYTYVEFSNGCGKDAPSFVAEFKGFYLFRDLHGSRSSVSYSSGLVLDFEAGDVVIQLGKITNKKL